MDEPLDLPENEEQEFFEHFRLTVDKGQGLLRIDKFLMARIENASRNKIQNAAKAGNILVNDKPVKQNYRVKPSDVISIVMAQPPRDFELKPENIPINVAYEDEHIIIINKEAGMVVHPGFGNYTGTLVNALIYHFISISQIKDADVRPGLVHRIDKNTSGILLVAKDEVVQTRLARMFFNKTIERVYHALVWGDFEEDEGTITGHIGRSLKDRRVMQVFPDGTYGKHAVTHYKVLERFGYVTLVECRLETGRTHQIRAHFRYIGHPLFNDETYGGNVILKGTTFAKYKQFINNCFEIVPRHCLHAKTLAFPHPVSGQPMHFDSDLPADMSQVLDKWRTYARYKEFDENI